MSTLEPGVPGSRQEGWIAETIAGYAYDAELEKTHAYALFLLLIPGLILLWFNLIPFLCRG